jgi:hypothetical protein
MSNDENNPMASHNSPHDDSNERYNNQHDVPSSRHNLRPNDPNAMYNTQHDDSRELYDAQQQFDHEGGEDFEVEDEAMPGVLFSPFDHFDGVDQYSDQFTPQAPLRGAVGSALPATAHTPGGASSQSFGGRRPGQTPLYQAHAGSNGHFPPPPSGTYPSSARSSRAAQQQLPSRLPPQKPASPDSDAVDNFVHKMKATQKQLKDKEAENANLRLVIQAIRDQIQHLQNEAQSSDERAVQAKNEVQRLNAKSRDAVKLVHAT